MTRPPLSQQYVDRLFWPFGIALAGFACLLGLLGLQFLLPWNIWGLFAPLIECLILADLVLALIAGAFALGHLITARGRLVERFSSLVVYIIAVPIALVSFVALAFAILLQASHIET